MDGHGLAVVHTNGSLVWLGLAWLGLPVRGFYSRSSQHAPYDLSKKTLWRSHYTNLMFPRTVQLCSVSSTIRYNSQCKGCMRPNVPCHGGLIPCLRCMKLRYLISVVQHHFPASGRGFTPQSLQKLLRSGSACSGFVSW